MKKQTKAKKATAGELVLEDLIAAYSRTKKGHVLNVYPWAVKIDRAIAAAVRKAVKAERERCVGCVQFKAKAWAEFALTLHPASESRPQVERVVDEFCSVIDAIREAKQ
jgi:hypothetical protein